MKYIFAFFCGMNTVFALYFTANHQYDSAAWFAVMAFLYAAFILLDDFVESIPPRP